MSRYLPSDQQSWTQATVRGGTVMDRSIVHEGEHGIRSAFFRMPGGTTIPEHTHPKWVQVMVLEGVMQVDTEEDGTVRIGAGGCYFVEPGDTHTETAVEDTLVLVTQGEDREAFLSGDS